MDASAGPPRGTLPRLLGWTAADAVIAVGIAFGFGLLAAALLVAVQAAGVPLGPRMASLGGLPALYIPVSLLGTLFAGLALWALHRRRLPAAETAWGARLLALVVLSALGLQALATGFTALTAASGVPSDGSNLALILDAYAAAPWFTLLAVALLAPLGEELVFRRVLLHRFAQAGRPLLGLLLTSLLFALIHEPLPGARSGLGWGLTLLTYAVLGAGFGWLYLRTRRLDAVVLAHVIVNLSGLALLFAQQP